MSLQYSLMMSYSNVQGSVGSPDGSSRWSLHCSLWSLCSSGLLDLLCQNTTSGGQVCDCTEALKATDMRLVLSELLV